MKPAAAMWTRTTITNAGAALSVMNGNVGIGTWVPRGKLDVEGLVSITTFAGNVGIGSFLPGYPLDVNGPIRTSLLTNAGSYTNTMAIGIVTPSSTIVQGAYFEEKRKGFSTNNQYGWLSFVSDSANANVESGIIDFGSYNGSTWTHSLDIDNSGNVAIGG